jgi:putative ABC transport system permease protein
VKALDRKLVRDLLQMKGQVVTIAIVVACGVASFVAALSNYDSLQLSQSEYYAATRFADVFVSLKRAPAALERQIAEIPGVTEVQTRLVYDVTLDLPNLAMPVVGRLISLPISPAQPRLNLFYLRRGRMPDPQHLDEVAVNEGFAESNRLGPGARVAAIINGRRQELSIVGVALSPEYIFATRGGDPLPDDRRFGVFWMNRKGLESAFNMEGAFDDAALKLGPGASQPFVIEEIDRLLDKYGGGGAYGRSEQLSNRFLTDEIRQQKFMATTIPVVFLAVAAFLLNIVLSRMVSAQQQQIAALKALGYDNAPIALHYFKMVLVMVALGSAIGLAAGAWLGLLVTESYTIFFRFPKLAYRIQPWVPALAIGISLLSGAAGAWTAVRRVVSLPPAQAMRPPTPRAYRASLTQRLGLARLLSSRAMMIVRGITGRPLRSAMTIVGTAASLPIIVLGLFWWDALDYMVQIQFNAAERADAIVGFSDPVSLRALHELQRLPGVEYVEGLRSVPVRLRSGQHSYRTAIIGVAGDARLRRLLDTHNRPLSVPPGGILLTDRLADRLEVRPGGGLAVEVLEGQRGRRYLIVAGLVNDLIGLSAYMDIDALNRLAGEGESISAAALSVDSAQEGAFYARLKETPKIATLTVRKETLRSFWNTTAKFVLVFSAILTVFAAAIAVGVVYNSARVALSERAWELASLRVMGFTRAEVSRLLLAELGLELALALPLGIVLSRLSVEGLVSLHANELFRIPAIIEPRTYGIAVAIVLAASAASALVVRRKVDALDLVEVLKTRE